MSPTGIVNFGETENGEAYVVSHTGAAVYRISAIANPVGIAENKNSKNPVSPKIIERTLYMNLDENANYQLLEIVNMNGTVVAKENIAGKTGAQQSSLEGLTAGIYLMRLSEGRNTYVHKLVVQ